MFHYSLRVIDEPKTSEIRILKLYHKKSILVDIYRKKPYFHGNKRISWPLLFFWQADARDCSGGLNKHKCPRNFIPFFWSFCFPSFLFIYFFFSNIFSFFDRLKLYRLTNCKFIVSFHFSKN